MMTTSSASRWAGLVVLAIAAGCPGDDERAGPIDSFGPGGGDDAATGDTDGSDAGATDDAADDGASGDAGDAGDETGPAPGCPGVCVPAVLEEQACPGGCGVQYRVCNGDCVWSPWSACDGAGGECTPGATQSCGTCMQQTCDDACTWGACEAVECTYTCMDGSARNGSEICDDEAFQMPDGPLFLLCVTAEGGVAYVANNTGPAQKDGVQRCQGWEDMGLDAWDHLDYVHMIDCTAVNLTVPIELPPGTQAWYGVHDQPEGGGHFTEVCVATAG